MLCETAIKRSAVLPLEVRIYDLIDSTNAEAKRQACDMARCGVPRLLLAKEQTLGRGRLGRSFQSRRGEGIYMSLLYYTESSLADAISVTGAAAVYVAEALEEVIGETLKIKWVNDIYNFRGKVCGILAESMKIGDGYAMIIGIGINTGDIEFPEELKTIAASVGDLFGKESLVVGNIAKKLLMQAAEPQNREYMRGYRARFMLEGKDVTVYKGGEECGCGRVVGVDDDCGLILLPQGAKESLILRSGEVSVRIKN